MLDAVRGAFFLILLIAALILVAVKGQEFFQKETFEKSVLPASVAINFEMQDEGHTLGYIGRRGHTVLGLLRQAARVRTFKTNHSWVYAINDLPVGPDRYWTYTVDGKSTDTPPGLYRTGPQETIVWTYRTKTKK